MIIDDGEIIFQVKIHRGEEKSFELVKLELNVFEQMAFEKYLESYLDAIKEYRKKDAIESYLEDQEEE